MSLTDRLTAAPVATETPRRARGSVMTGMETGVRVEPDGATLVTTPDLVEMLGNEEDWREAVQGLGVTVPDGWVVRLVEMRYDPAGWHRDSEDSKAVTRPVWRYRFKVEPSLATVDIDDLIERVQSAEEAPLAPAPEGTGAFLVAIGDTQFGKMDGDGVEGTIQRVLDSTERAAERYLELEARSDHGFETVYIAWLGDCIEGFVSQGGGNAWRTPMTLTEQVRIVRRLMLHQIDTFRELAPNVVLLSIPGNHDEAVRFKGGKSTRGDDSWAVEAAVSVSDAMELNPEAYGHVSVKVPGRDELTLTVDMAGTIVGLAHGHQTGNVNKTSDWWAGQAHGLQPIGEATVLLTAHFHHLRIEQTGPKTWIQVPAMEGESTWWRHRKGLVAPQGVITALVGGDVSGWSDLQVV